MASKVLSMRFAPAQMDRLQRVARRLGRTPSETSALLVEESLRRTEFALVDFRDSVAGRQAYMQGSSLAIWEVVLVGRGYAMDAQRTARHLGWPVPRVQAAFNYAQAFPEEIEAALADNAGFTSETVLRMLPQARPFPVPPAVPAPESGPREARRAGAQQRTAAKRTVPKRRPSPRSQAKP